MLNSTLSNIKRRAFWFWAAAAFVCMLVIFLFSAQPAEESSAASGSLTRTIVGVVFSWFMPVGQEVPESLLELAEVGLRKSAHLLVFSVLGFCTANAVKHLTERRQRVFWISLCWCSAYGALDELHQYFVPGRACMWQDWVLDTVGTALGVGLAMVFARRKLKMDVSQPSV